jgi:hypothetical protein
MRNRGLIFNTEYVDNYNYENPLYTLVTAAKWRAKKSGLPFNITAYDLEVPELCPYLKKPFMYKTPYAMSLDRVVPELGYTKENVEVISRKANIMKSNASVEELLEFAYTILERH